MPDGRYGACMETLEFSTPQRKRRAEHVTVTLAGEDMIFHRPKDATLWAASTTFGEEVTAGDRAMGLLQFINGTLDPTDQKRFYERVTDRDDELGQRAVFNLVRELVAHWGPEGGGRGPLVAEQDEPVQFYGDEPIKISNADVGLEFVAHPPKDIALMLMASGLATGARLGQQAWAVGFFLDACTDTTTRVQLGARLRARHDPLEMEDVTDIVLGLMQKWAPEYLSEPSGNRATRRAATRKTTGGTARKTTGASGGARSRK